MGFQPGGFEPMDDDDHLPQHRRGSRMLVIAAVGTLALIVVGAIAFAGSLLMAKTSNAGSPSKVAAGAAQSPSGPAGDPLGAMAMPSGDPTGNATTAAPTTGAATPKATPTPTKAKTATTTQPAGSSAYEAQVLAIVNSERAKAGCQPLNFNAKLRAAAYKHSADMAARNYFSHDTPEGVSFATRITNEGYRWSNAAENIAKGQRTPEDVMKAWMNSPGHRANILNCKLKDLGVGLAYQGKTPIWTQDFGTLM